ncbi:alanine dehydrogenase [Microbacterium sp. MPKO10]|uniref:alanine dehydrogenase n=1 Tax=Microbacterium sp. MPKO10 TaxID=2989818 RepID=UPI0022364897|nr:alanine dehydrogenase [Microbacterium sp. MPKO10]MCW4458356.1 alanine dehydrogenase [Microbacterium sp. MPKO10]
MRIAVPTEIKNNEYRVAMTPAGAHDLIAAGHEIIVQAGAGEGSSIPDSAFEDVGARIVADADDVWASAELVLKVKEPIASEYRHFRKHLVLFTYLHLAADKPLTDALLDSGMTALAYETVELADRSLPLLAPMSEVAGRLSAIVGAHTLLKPAGGPGLLVPGVPGTHPANVTVIGGGVAGSNAAHVALGLGARVTVLDTNLARLREIDALYGGRIETVASNAFEIDRSVTSADLVIGSVLVPGARAPKLVTGELVSRMRQGSVLVDIAIDQGGCFEDSHPTTHADPTFPVHGSLFYCVANMPGAVPHTSTYALTNATLPYIRAVAAHGWRAAAARDTALLKGVNVTDGQLTNRPVAEAHALEHTPAESLVADQS